jgi:hypothetical protein
MSESESELDSYATMQLDGSCGVFHADGTHSIVYRQLEQSGEGKTRWVAVKTVSFLANQSTKPHDVLKEAKLLLEEIKHVNVSFSDHRVGPQCPVSLTHCSQARSYLLTISP